MTDQLKPCPFCGGDSLSIHDGWICCPLEYEAYVACFDCDAQGSHECRYDTLEEARAAATTAWNTRAPVNVKPLVWHEGDEPDEWASGEYDIWCELGKYQLYYWSIVNGEPHDTAEASKAAAQADYEARVLAALDL